MTVAAWRNCLGQKPLLQFTIPCLAPPQGYGCTVVFGKVDPRGRASRVVAVNPQDATLRDRTQHKRCVGEILKGNLSGKTRGA
jgi:hypothetical protein